MLVTESDSEGRFSVLKEVVAAGKRAFVASGVKGSDLRTGTSEPLRRFLWVRYLQEKGGNG